MSSPILRTFTIQVQQTFVFYNNVEVRAATETEAEKQAIEEFQCDWSKSDHTETTTSIIAVEEGFLAGLLEKLHCRFDGLPLERAREQARELLGETLLNVDEVLETYLRELRACRRCGSAWLVCDMAEAEDDGGTHYLCKHCS